MLNDITISYENRKLKNCNVFNLPVGLTCKPGVKCSTFCYAKKAERMYKAVRPSRMRNYKASKLKSFVSKMTILLRKSPYNTVRTHESGDYYSKEYVKKWYDIANALPDFTFFSFTKRDDIFDDDLLALKPKNFKLIWSVDGIQPDDLPMDGCSLEARTKGYDKVAIVRETKHTCPSTSKNKWKVACVKHCKICMNDTNTIIEFSKH